MNRMLRSSRWHSRLMYLLLALALIAGLVLIQGNQVAGDSELTVAFVVDKTWVDCGKEVSFDPTPTSGGTLPYTRARWDFDGDGTWDDDSDVTGKDPLAIVTHAYCQAGLFYPCLEMTDNSTPPEVSIGWCATPPNYILVGKAPTVDWYLEYGLDADPAAVNIWTYPGYAVELVLANLDWSMPDGLLIWHYGGPGVGWRFYKQGWGTVNTLATVVPEEGYIGIVSTASVWHIHQSRCPC